MVCCVTSSACGLMKGGAIPHQDVWLDCRFHFLPYWPATPDGLQAAATAGSTSAAAAGAAGHAGGTAAAALTPVNGTVQSAQTHACLSSSGPSSSSHHLQQQQQQQLQLQQQQQLSFTQDGLYLRHTGGHYSLGGISSPLALLWKDESCSRYLLVSTHRLFSPLDCTARVGAGREALSTSTTPAVAAVVCASLGVQIPHAGVGWSGCRAAALVRNSWWCCVSIHVGHDVTIWHGPVFDRFSAVARCRCCGL